MVTAELIRHLAYADGPVRAQAFANLVAAAGNPAAYQVVWRLFGGLIRPSNEWPS